ncbi:MAG: sulfatase-like hydrolase/transferase [Opitutales bacterium]|nr:sulfatase-like hydrolase/transferase [Opitutales bacterium]
MFWRCPSSSAVCTPSRYSILTGRYCWRTWLKRYVLGGGDRGLIEEGRLTVPGLLGRAGYRSAYIGKWHLGWNWPARPGQEPQYGVPPMGPDHGTGIWRPERGQPLC